MTDPRYHKLAHLLVHYSTRLRRGQCVLIDCADTPDEMVIALVRAARAAGAVPLVQTTRPRITRELLREATPAQFDLLARLELARMKKVQAYIAIRGSDNITELSDVPPHQMQLAMQRLRPVLNWRVRHTAWVVLRWPTPAMAQQAGMSTEAFEEFFFRVCTMDYAKMARAMTALKTLMERTETVEIKGPGTDLRFSIKGIPAIACAGTMNLPDGEVFTAPVRRSVQGYVTFNAPTIYQGVAFDNIRLEFRDGKIVRATASDTDRLNRILDSDPGARFIGEFALGLNPYIREPMRDILFDEKISGSFHLTPGQAYDEADNGNRSQVHWDMVCIQRPEYGGGTIHFDGKLVRKDGLFVPKSLHGLNPANLR